MSDELKKLLERTKHRVETAPAQGAPMVRRRTDENYDMTMEFLTGVGNDARPATVTKILENLHKVAPAHARVLAEYIEGLETELGGE